MQETAKAAIQKLSNSTVQLWGPTGRPRKFISCCVFEWRLSWWFYIMGIQSTFLAVLNLRLNTFSRIRNALRTPRGSYEVIFATKRRRNLNSTFSFRRRKGINNFKIHRPTEFFNLRRFYPSQALRKTHMYSFRELVTSNKTEALFWVSFDFNGSFAFLQ